MPAARAAITTPVTVWSIVYEVSAVDVVPPAQAVSGSRVRAASAIPAGRLMVLTFPRKPFSSLTLAVVTTGDKAGNWPTGGRFSRWSRAVAESLTVAPQRGVRSRSARGAR